MRFSNRRDISDSQSTASIELANEVFGGAWSDIERDKAACTLADSGSYFCAPQKAVVREPQRQQKYYSPHRRAFRKASISADRYHLCLGIGTAFVLESAFREAAFANDDAVRDANQLHFGKHNAGALVSVVKQYIDAGLLQLGIELVGGLFDRCALA